MRTGTSFYVLHEDLLQEGLPPRAALKFPLSLERGIDMDVSFRVETWEETVEDAFCKDKGMEEENKTQGWKLKMRCSGERTLQGELERG